MCILFADFIKKFRGFSKFSKIEFWWMQIFENLFIHKPFLGSREIPQNRANAASQLRKFVLLLYSAIFAIYSSVFWHAILAWNLTSNFVQTFWNLCENNFEHICLLACASAQNFREFCSSMETQKAEWNFHTTICSKIFFYISIEIVSFTKILLFSILHLFNFAIIY